MKNNLSIINKIFDYSQKKDSKIAIKFGGQTISYKDLESRMKELSTFLQKNKIIKQKVAILIPKGIEHVITLLGVMKSNNVFVPIDYKLPEKRIKTMLKSANITFVIANDVTYNKIRKIDENITILNIDKMEITNQLRLRRNYNNRGCYIFFTSGSTGFPKAILGSYEGLLKFLTWEIKNFNITNEYNVSFMSAIGFDPMLRDIFIPLMVGGTLVIPTEEQLLDIDKFQEWLVKNKITLMHIVPTLFKHLFKSIDNPGILKRLKYIILAGELLHGKDIEFFYNQKFDQHTTLINFYGPTETTLAKFWYKITENNITDKYIPVGNPISNVRYSIVEQSGRKVNDGTVGEILIEPDFKLLGYYDNEKLNNKVFIRKIKNDDGYDIYKTGDLGIKKDGILTLVGRKDSQVKLNGVRIELNEIENSALEIREINDVRVLMIEEKLVLFYSANEILNKGVILKVLQERLPKQVIPQECIFLKDMPKNNSGKIDKIQLQKLYEDMNKNNANESWIAKLFEKTIGIKYYENDEIDLAIVDSLKLAKLKNGLQELGIKLTLKELMGKKKFSDFDELLANVKVQKQEKVSSKNKTNNKCNIIQEKMYYASKFAKNTVYNIIKVIELPKDINMNKLNDAIRKNVEKIDLFNSIFYEKNEKLYIKKCKSEYALEAIAFSNSIEESVYSWAKIFDLAQEHLWQIGILENLEHKYLVFNIHHLICDEASLELFVNQIFDLYYDDIEPQYEKFTEFLTWINREYEENSVETRRFITERLDGICNIDLPYDRIANDFREFVGEEVKIKLQDKEIMKKLKEVSIRKGITFYSLFNAVINILLAKYSQSEDITVSTPVGIRGAEKFERIFGPLINVVPIRNIINYDESISNYLSRVAINNAEIIDHPLIEMEDILFEDKTKSINISYTFHNKCEYDDMLKKFKISEVNLNTKTSKFKLMFEVVLHKENIELRIEYDKFLFNKDTIQRITEHFVNCLNLVLENMDSKIKEVEFITEEELKIYKELDNLDAEYDKQITVVDIFKNIVKKYPNKIAVKYGEQDITYSNLDKKSNSIANYILNKGITGETIGIISEKNIDCMAMIIGIIKSGNAYVPINITYPSERINYIVNDLNSKMILTNKSLIDKYELNVETLIAVEDIVASDKSVNQVNIKQTDPLYVIYTSGTTGKPKGAVITHRNLIRLLFNSKFQYDFNENDVWTMFHSYCFDFSVWEMYGALLYGAKLVLIPEFVSKDPREYLKLLRKENVTVLNQTPSYFYKLTEEEMKNSDSGLKLRYVIFGGEALDIGKTKSFHDKYMNTELINMYGITETTVHVTYKKITEKDYYNGNSNIGKPIPTLKIVLLDKNRKLQAVGVPGEIFVIGDGVCNGYVNNEVLTKERFTFSEKEHSYMYKSGDLAKLMPNGDLVYMGRNDEQVKIRGFRIELGEIENAIKMLEPSINNLVVTTRKDHENNVCIVVYYSGNKVIQFKKIKKQLLTIIPEYMLPSYMIHVDSIPLTVNGKADKKKLNEIPIIIESNVEYVEPRNKTEKSIKKIWQSVLGVEKISIKDNFFELGGDSFKALKASYMSNDLYTIQKLYENPTIELLASNIMLDTQEDNNRIYYQNVSDNPIATVVMVPYAGGETIVYNELAKALLKLNQKINIAIIDTNAIRNTLQSEVDNIVESLREKNSGAPFIIYTHCAGDGMGVYLGEKLRAKKEDVRQIIIGASLPPTINPQEYFEFNFWKNSSDNEILEFLQKLDSTVDYTELNRLDLFIDNFRRTVEIRRELLYNLIKSGINEKNQATLIFGLKDCYTEKYIEEASNWNEYVEVKEIITFEDGQHYFINSHYKQIADVIYKFL